VRKSQEVWAKYLGRKVEEEDEIAPGVKMKFVLVPPGKFLMGSPKDEKDRGKDEVQHEVELTKPIYLGVYDVTQPQYEAVTGKNPSEFKGADLPVEAVRWEEADAFATKLTEKVKGGLVYRLPTEAEWEYSCRGGRPSSEPFGIDDPNLRDHGSIRLEKGILVSGLTTIPVGTYPANALGLYDMQGNVWEWCGDWYGDYPTGHVVDPTGPAEGSSRVFRGGGWGDRTSYCRAAFRDGRGMSVLNMTKRPTGTGPAFLGFRLARVPPSGPGK
jgi:formylglycine-generating enzyme required for sulfatase activity